jgi:hypothetical protein
VRRIVRIAGEAGLGWTSNAVASNSMTACVHRYEWSKNPSPQSQHHADKHGDFSEPSEAPMPSLRIAVVARPAP